MGVDGVELSSAGWVGEDLVGFGNALEERVVVGVGSRVNGCVDRIGGGRGARSVKRGDLFVGVMLEHLFAV